MSDGTVAFVSRDRHALPIVLLRWNPIMQEIYGGNADSVSLKTYV